MHPTTPRHTALRLTLAALLGLAASAFCRAAAPPQAGSNRPLPVRSRQYYSPARAADGELVWRPDPGRLEEGSTLGTLRVRGAPAPAGGYALIQHGGLVVELEEAVPAGLPIRVSFRARHIAGAPFIMVNRRFGGSRPWVFHRMAATWQPFTFEIASARFPTTTLSINIKAKERPRLAAMAEGSFEIADLTIACPARSGGQVPMRRAAAVEATAFPVAIPYTLDAAGTISLGVYDERGRLVRTILSGATRAAGRHSARWDGLDRHGRPQPPGEYAWRLLRTPGFEAEYLLTLGVNPGTQPWDLWPGPHSGICAVHVTGTSLTLASGITEHAPFVIRQSLDGQRRLWENYGRGHGYGSLQLDSAIALGASGGDTLALARNGLVTLWREGAPAGGRVKTFDIFTADERRRGVADDLYGAGDMAVGDGWFAVSSRRHSFVRIFDMATQERSDRQARIPLYRGEIRRLDLSNVVSVATGPEETLLALAGVRVLRCAVKDEAAPEVVIPALPFETTARIACAVGRGELLIAAGSPHPNQVLRYSLSGERRAAYGRPGGRRWGAYDPQDFHRIRDLYPDGRGGFVVAEEGKNTLRRTAHFDAAGTLVNEWYGPPPWGSYPALAPDDPSVGVVQLGSGIVAWVAIDAEKRTWRVTHSWAQPDTDGMFVGFGGGRVWRIVDRGAERFLVNAGEEGSRTPVCVYRVEAETGRPIPWAAAGRLAGDTLPQAGPAWWQAAVARHAGGDGHGAARYTRYAWGDENGDGTIDAAEVHLTADRAQGAVETNQVHIEPDWSIIFAQDDGKTVWGRLPNTREGAGPPRWRWDRFQALPWAYPAAFAASARGFGASGVWRDPQGGSYQLLFGNRSRPDRHGQVWPGSTIGTARFIKWNPKGELEWEVGNHGTRVDLPPGRFQCPRRILGGIHGCVVPQDRTLRLAMVWTADGLYAGSFRDRRAADGLPDVVYQMSRGYPMPGILLGDNTDGTLFTTPADDVLWGPAGCSGSPLYRIRGWQGWRRQTGALRVTGTPPAARGAGTGLRGAYYGTPVRLKATVLGTAVHDTATDEADLLGELTGEAAPPPDTPFAGEALFTRVDPQLRFGSRTFPPQDNHIKRPRPWGDPATAAGRMFAGGFFAVRWTGRLEPRFTEPYRIVVEHQRGHRLRLWLDGALCIDAWQPEAEAPRRLSTVLRRSSPVALTAGQPVQIRIDYVAAGVGAHIHLKWESSQTQEQRYIPTAHLYPAGSESEALKRKDRP